MTLCEDTEPAAGNFPARLNFRTVLSPGERLPLLKPPGKVTLWSTFPLFVHFTFPPGRTLAFAGLKKLSPMVTLNGAAA